MSVGESPFSLTPEPEAVLSLAPEPGEAPLLSVPGLEPAPTLAVETAPAAPAAESASAPEPLFSAPPASEPPTLNTGMLDGLTTPIVAGPPKPEAKPAAAATPSPAAAAGADEPPTLHGLNLETRTQMERPDNTRSPAAAAIAMIRGGVSEPAGELSEPALNFDSPAVAEAAPKGVQAVISGTALKTAKPRQDPKEIRKPTQWIAATLKQEKHPLAAIVAKILEKPCTGALIFVRGGGGKLLNGGIQVEPGYREALWTGMQWNSEWLPELWKNLSRSGAMEISPPVGGKISNAAGNRNVLRAAIGAGSDEWVTLMTAGSAEDCQAIIAVLSKASLLAHLEPLKAQLKAVKVPAA